MKNKMGKFSIIVPVYNGEHVIEKCIDSILNLNYPNWELLIVNDSSTDATEELCSGYLNDSRIKLFNKQNGGVSSSRNVGLKEAVGEYIIFVDADDYVDSRLCDVFIAQMQDSDYCISAYTRCYVNGRLEIAETDKKISAKQYNIEEFATVFGTLYKSGFINSPWAKCYRRELIDSEFDCTLSLGEDFIFNLHYLLNCNNVKLSFEPVYYYVVQESGSLTSGLIKKGFNTLNIVYKESINLLKLIFNLQPDVYDEINKKYAIDMMCMLERNIRFNVNFDGYQEVKAICKDYKLDNVFNTISLRKYGIKWEIQRQLLVHRKYKLFSVFNEMLFRGKKCFLRRK